MNLTAIIPLLTLLQESGVVSPKRPAVPQKQITPPRLSELGLGFKERALTGAIFLTPAQIAGKGPSRLGLRPKGL
jgi:hypothetical protein